MTEAESRRHSDLAPDRMPEEAPEVIAAAVPGLPGGLRARIPGPQDIAALVRLLAQQRRWACPAAGSAIDRESVREVVSGPASWTRRHVVVESAADDPAAGGPLIATASVHDRAAGRTMIEVVIDPEARHADELAGALFAWAADAAIDVARSRALPGTQLDSGAYRKDERQQRWLRDAGYRHVRTWRQETRAVEAGEPAPPLRPGVRLRQVRTHPDGTPVGQDLRTVHDVIEESFADHFNNHRESLAEFIQRLREDPGHAWDHWWIAEVAVERDGGEGDSGEAGTDRTTAESGDVEWVPGGALVGSISPEDAEGFEGSYVDYLGVTRAARGRGVARALLWAVIEDASRRGCNRVGLEVDADSPSGADTLYDSMGWRTTYETQSWHRDIEVPPAESI